MEHDSGGGSQDAAPKKDLGGFAPGGEFTVLNRDGTTEGGDLKEAEAAIREFGGMKRGTKSSSITAHGQVPPPKETANLEDYRGGVIEQDPSRRGAD